MEHRVWHDAYDAGVPTAIELQDRTLVDRLKRAAREFPDRPALVFLNARITYEDLHNMVERLATALTNLGVVSGSRVAILMPNLPQFVIAYYGALRAGAIAMPTNPLYTHREIEDQWTDAGADVAIVTDYLYAANIAPIADRLPVKHYIVSSIPDYLRFPLNFLAPIKLKRQDPPLIARVPLSKNVHAFKTLIERTAPAPPPPPTDLDGVATLLYTGGTTGPSKGAMLTHRNLSINVEQLASWVSGIERGTEVMLTMLPLFHSYGLTVAMNFGIGTASTLVLIPNPRDIPAIIKAISKHRVTMAPAVPATYNAIIRHPDVEKFDISSVKVCNSGSAPLPVDVLEEFERRTGGKITEGFGLTETSPVTHSNPVQGIRKVGSIGVPLPGTDAKILDPDTGSTSMPVNDVGELVIAGPQVMAGYWNRPEETLAMIRDGWLYTGDLARMDEDGFFFIEGRKKDMILCSGFNVYPDEIDRLLMAHPAVLETGTIGIPDEKRGETVKSFVVLRQDAHITPEALIAYCRDNMASYKVPRAIEFRDELPKSTVLKILRRELRAQELAKSKA